MTNNLPTIDIKGKGKFPFICITCSVTFYRWKYQQSKFCSRKCMGMYSSQNPNKGSFIYTAKTGVNHHAWKHDNVGYDALHDWINAKKGKADHCEGNDSHTNRKYNWANISGEYKRDIKDFVSLCVGCHRKFDKYAENMKLKYGEDHFKKMGKKGLETRYANSNS